MLTLSETDAAFEAIGRVTGPGSQAERRRLLAGFFGRATMGEREFLVRLLAGDLRQGALEGVMTDAVAKAAAVPAEEVRRAHQLGGSLPAVAQAALGGTEPLTALRAFTLVVGRPVRPMLAASAPDIAAGLDRISPAAAEWKIDGIRVQVHRPASRSPCSPAHWTTSRHGCLRSPRLPCPCRSTPWSWTARRRRSPRTGGRGRSRSPPPAPRARSTSAGSGPRPRLHRSFSTCCT